MGNKFIQGVEVELQKTTTENGANAFNTTKSKLLDLFGTIGSLRSRNAADITRKFDEAYAENPLLAMKMVFYARNIRGGLGERRTFRILIKHLANNYTAQFENNVYYIPQFGRWDDLYALFDTPLEDFAIEMMSNQLNVDLYHLFKGESVSLLAKWMKSNNTSSKESVRLANITAKKMGLTSMEYRVVLSTLRRRIGVVEINMSANEWNDIPFKQIPSQAMNKYKGAFMKHAPVEFSQYIEDLTAGKTTINSGAIYPYQLIKNVLEYGIGGKFKGAFDPIVEAQWKALPNYVSGENNFMVMADTSGSMWGDPMYMSISLAIYFAERNKGAYKDLFMTFSSKPEYIQLKGNSLADKIGCVKSIIDSTDLKAAFKLVLNTAIKHNVPAADMPKAILVISDGEIDHFNSQYHWDFLKEMEARFMQRGYELPKVVMWNVASRADRFLTQMDNPKVQFVSGCSPSIFKTVINGLDKSAYELMVMTLSDPVYECITC